MQGRLWLTLAALFLSGCIGLPPATSLNAPANVYAQPKVGGVWVNRVVVRDSRLNDNERKVVESAFTQSITTYVKKKKVASFVKNPPEEKSTDDIILDFEFDKYYFERSMHPAYFPASILTLTIYIWANGPVGIDEMDIDAKLIVKDSSGNKLSEFSKKIHNEENVGIYDDNYMFPVTDKVRTGVVESLLSDYFKTK